MQFFALLTGTVDLQALAAKVKPIEDNSQWKEIRKASESIFNQCCGGGGGSSGNLNGNGVRQYFRLVGKQHFGQDLSTFFSDRLMERFDWDGTNGLSHLQAFRALRKAILARCPVCLPPCKESSVSAMGYTKIKLLASGGQGSAWLADYNKGGQKEKRVLKIYSKNNANAGGLKELQDEFHTMSEVLSDPTARDHVMQAYEIFQDGNCFYCVNEVCGGGDLAAIRKNYMMSHWGNSPNMAYWRTLFKQCMTGINVCHKHGIIHCDIKEPNIMLATASYHSPQIKIIDLGMAQATASKGEAGGTPGYRPPETNIDNIWFPQGDIFSLGVVFFQLLIDQVPCDKRGQEKMGIFQEGAMSIRDVIQFTANRDPNWGKLGQHKASEAEGILRQMLAKDRRRRPRAQQLLHNETFFSQCPDKFPGGGMPGGGGGGGCVCF